MMMKELFSDEQLRLAVQEALAGDETTARFKLRVGVLNAVVHLAGFAPKPSVWDLAAEIAANVSGVRGVVNRIDAPGAPSPSRIIHLDSLSNSSRENFKENYDER
jgi:osmotically-inducible protein OsmY